MNKETVAHHLTFRFPKLMEYLWNFLYYFPKQQQQ